MTAYSYIELKSSDGTTINKKFRVVADGTYDDGTLEKAETMERTISGGTDYCAGGVYTIWNPTIMVRHTEPVTGYGTLAELKTLYSYNNPKATPSNRITFVDNHGTSNTVVFTGPFQQAVLGCMIEGNTAWYLVKVSMTKVSQ